MNNVANITSLAQAFSWADETIQQHPECDARAAYDAAFAGRPRSHPVFWLNHNGNYPFREEDLEPEFALPRVELEDPIEVALAREVVGLLAPLKMLNPVERALGMPGGVRALMPSFGLPLDPLNPGDGTVTHHSSAAELLWRGMPDPAESGLLPAMRQRIELIKRHSPVSFRIGLPDMQGPFNLIHAIISDEAMYLPSEDPEQWQELMQAFTTFWMAVWDNLVAWIGPERLGKTHRLVRIAECDVNLVSERFYTCNILPFDQMIARRYGEQGLHIHPCSGRHVFRATLQGLPNVVMTEAGEMIETKVAAAQISVDEALRLIGDRPIMLSIGQELPLGQEFEFIARDFDRARGNHRLLFSYTGVNWQAKDRPMIRDLHRRLNDYWRDSVYTGA